MTSRPERRLAASNDKHPHGRVQVYDGAQWVSDFRQNKLLPCSNDTTHRARFMDFLVGSNSRERRGYFRMARGPQMKLGRVVIYYLLLLVLHASSGQAADSSLAASSREFVQKFYASYVPKALAGHTGPAWQFAIDKMSASFDGGLLGALKDDLAAQAQSSGDDIVGLDFDPFLNSQDPAERYEVGSARQEGTKYLVDVYPVMSGKRSKEPSVVPELAYENGHWLFVNFRYPGDDDLLTILGLMKADRESNQN